MNLEQRNGVATTQEFAKPRMSFEMLRQEVDGDTADIVWKASDSRSVASKLQGQVLQSDSAEKPSVHPSRASGRTEERLKSLVNFRSC